MNEPDDNGGWKKKGEGISEILDSLSSSDDDDDDDGNGGESMSKRRGSLDCLASLEAPLPIKRGMSSHYYGKSKSFGNLTELSIEDSKDLGKKEHAINKRRRLLMAHEYLRRGATSTITHASSMPLFLSEEEYDYFDYESKKGNGGKNQEQDGN